MQAEVPEIEPIELKTKLDQVPSILLVDVRETWELECVRVEHPNLIHLPMSILSRKQLDAIPQEMRNKNSEVIILCHHGVRSATVTQWLGRNGWLNVRSLRGGIDAYASQVDPSIGFY